MMAGPSLSPPLRALGRRWPRPRRGPAADPSQLVPFKLEVSRGPGQGELGPPLPPPSQSAPPRPRSPGLAQISCSIHGQRPSAAALFGASQLRSPSWHPFFPPPGRKVKSAWRGKGPDGTLRDGRADPLFGNPTPGSSTPTSPQCHAGGCHPQVACRAGKRHHLAVRALLTPSQRTLCSSVPAPCRP